MGVLAVYDMVGIQNYVFSSNKLAENVGASLLVRDIFEKTLPEAIKEATGGRLFKWKEHVDEPLSDELAAEIIYTGRGNAYVAFKQDAAPNFSTFNNVTKEFLTQVNIEARGVGIAIAAIGTDFSNCYKSDFSKLDKRLKLARGGFNIPIFAGGQPLTKQAERTGLPASVYLEDDDEYLSTGQCMKREMHKKSKAAKFRDFDDLAFDKGADNLIAIVHVDGNNIWGGLKKFTEDSPDAYDEAVPEFRKLFKRMGDCYDNARERTKAAFEKEYKLYIEKFPEIDDKTPPLIDLVSDVDDTTIVICGRFAIDYAKRLLCEIEATQEEQQPFLGSVPASCAGVAIFHSHYPFSEAYKLAEELCASAKKPSRSFPGSYIDFHLHQSGEVSDLKAIRERQRMVDGKSLLRSPWRVTGDSYENLLNKGVCRYDE